MHDPRIVGPCPDPDTPPQGLRVVVPHVGKPLYLTILSPKIIAVVTHWLTPQEHPPSGRLVRCDWQTCEHCRCCRPKRWSGFLAAWDHVTQSECVSKVTWNGASILLQMVPSHESLRGKQVECHRLGESNKNPIWWKHGTRRHLDPVPDTPDILPTLALIYGPEVLEQLRGMAQEQEGLS